MGLNVRELRTERSADFERNPAFQRQMSSAGEGCNSIRIVDQSDEEAKGLEMNMNTRKRYNALNHRNQGGGGGLGLNHACRSETVKSNWLKNRLKLGIAPEIRGGIPDQLLNRAVAEAEALAWSTSHPLLFLPGLVEEKVLGANQWANRQRKILERQRTLAADSVAITE
jgi:hypothetical protein